MRPRLTFANVVSVIALFVALGGGAYAAIVLPKNSVESRNIVNGEVKKHDIADNAITKRKIQDNTIKGADVDESSLGQVPSAATAGDSSALGGLEPGAYGGVLTARVNGLSQSANSSSDRFAPVVGISTITPTESDTTTLSPARSMVARDLSMKTTTSLGALSDDDIVTLVVNGNQTALSCFVSGSIGSCQDNSDAVTVPANSEICLQITEEANPVISIGAHSDLIGLRLSAQ